MREALDDAARDRLVTNIVGHLLHGVTEPVLERAFQYWRNVDKNLGDRVEAGVRGRPSVITYAGGLTVRSDRTEKSEHGL